MPLRSEELDLEINQISIEIHHSDIFLLHENPLMFLCFFFGRSMDAFRGMERSHPWVLTSPAPRQVLEEAGTSISDRTRSYAADTSHDKHSGCVMGAYERIAWCKRKGKYLLMVQRSGGEKPTWDV